MWFCQGHYVVILLFHPPSRPRRERRSQSSFIVSPARKSAFLLTMLFSIGSLRIPSVPPAGIASATIVARRSRTSDHRQRVHRSGPCPPLAHHYGSSHAVACRPPLARAASGRGSTARDTNQITELLRGDHDPNFLESLWKSNVKKKSASMMDTMTAQSVSLSQDLRTS